VVIVVLGAPRTKKNSGEIWRPKGGGTRFVASAAYRRWEKAALPQLRRAWAGRIAITQPVNVRATFYREANIGDAVGYYQALADALEKAGVLVNDRLIVSWDGTRIAKDNMRPRIELEIEPLDVTTSGGQRHG
jgi:Holliday junction resolvase RusA-like endonuclease